MLSVFSQRLPREIGKLIWEFAREKTRDDYQYRWHRDACQLFPYEVQSQGDYYGAGDGASDGVDFTTWTYDIWVEPSHPCVKAVEITFGYRARLPRPQTISLANKRCFELSKMTISPYPSRGGALAIAPDYSSFSLKRETELDVWELERWTRFLQKLSRMALLDYHLLRYYRNSSSDWSLSL